MSTSATARLSTPTGDNKISSGTLGYICARNRQEAYNLVIREFKKSGLTQAQLARRLGKSPEIISRLFSRPRNWELDTLSEMLFAICGAAIKIDAAFPRDATSSRAESVSFTNKEAHTKSEVVFRKHEMIEDDTVRYKYATAV